MINSPVYEGVQPEPVTSATTDNGVDLYLAHPRGFCAGVNRAIEVVRRAIAHFGPPVYVRHAIVHNPHVVEELAREGARFVEEIEEIPKDSIAIFSAHGVSPAVREAAQRRNLKILDATCPLVTRVHTAARRYAEESYTILLIGHRRHVEVEGTLGEAPEKIRVIETLEEARKLTPPKGPVALLTQTTLSVDDTREMITLIREKIPHLVTPSSESICYATQNRQDAVKLLAARADLILVIGSSTSSNSLRLKEVARRAGCSAHLIQGPEELDRSLIEGHRAIGITSGASTPEHLVEAVVGRIQDWLPCRIFHVEGEEEKITFAPLTF